MSRKHRSGKLKSAAAIQRRKDSQLKRYYDNKGLIKFARYRGIAITEARKLIKAAT